MATEYPQRWLREHQAVPTEQGWKLENGELLKVQKGLEIDEEEIGDRDPDREAPEPELVAPVEFG